LICGIALYAARGDPKGSICWTKPDEGSEERDHANQAPPALEVIACAKDADADHNANDPIDRTYVCFHAVLRFELRNRAAKRDW
jgi:hypothetical protein